MTYPAPRPKAPTLESVTTINEDGSRYFIHTADVSGPFTTWRRVAGWLLLFVYASLPFIQINGYPAVFLDTSNQRFHVFGLTFAAQDMWLMFFLISGLGFLLFFVTALFGRLWCGWACPQTVFLDHVIRRIERFVDGDAPRRRALDAAPWTFSKAWRRALKYTLFFIFALIVAHMFFAYFVSLPSLYQAMRSAPFQNWSLFVMVFGMATLLFIDFAWFREQFCIILCPYGRFQSALIDEHSMVIGYDERRGEPRGKATDPTKGDCIDCRRCVQVCPTGIDIRHGLQMECIGCANCIDACDEIMRQLNRRPGLIRYDSLRGLEGGRTKWLRLRTFIYSILLLIGAGVMTYALSTIKPATLVITRMTGAPYYIANGTLRNQFFVRIINKTAQEQSYSLSVKAGNREISVAGAAESIPLGRSEEMQRVVVVSYPVASFDAPFPLEVQLRGADGKILSSRETTFLGPDPATL